MKRPSKPSLADYLSTKVVASGDPDVWAQITRWQREGLLSVRPLSRHSAEVTITDAGRARIAGSATQAAGERA